MKGDKSEISETLIMINYGLGYSSIRILAVRCLDKIKAMLVTAVPVGPLISS